MRVLVTGPSGFIGAHVAGHLADHGFEVVGFSRSQPPPWWMRAAAAIAWATVTCP